MNIHVFILGSLAVSIAEYTCKPCSNFHPVSFEPLEGKPKNPNTNASVKISVKPPRPRPGGIRTSRRGLVLLNLGF